MEKNLDSICAEIRPDIVENIESNDDERDYETTALADAFAILNSGEQFPPHNITETAVALLEFIDIDGDKRVKSSELWQQIREVF